MLLNPAATQTRRHPNLASDSHPYLASNNHPNSAPHKPRRRRCHRAKSLKPKRSEPSITQSWCYLLYLYVCLLFQLVFVQFCLVIFFSVEGFFFLCILNEISQYVCSLFFGLRPLKLLVKFLDLLGFKILGFVIKFSPFLMSCGLFTVNFCQVFGRIKYFFE